MKKTTLIVLGIFVLLLVFLLILETKDIKLLAQTPSPTVQVKVLEGMLVEEIFQIEFQSGDLEALTIQKNSDNSWSFRSSTNLVDQGKVQELLSNLENMVILAGLESEVDLKQIGLSSPQAVITLTSSNGGKKEIWIGASTPTGSGYYVMVNNQEPVVISKFVIDSILEIMAPTSLILQLPTP